MLVYEVSFVFKIFWGAANERKEERGQGGARERKGEAGKERDGWGVRVADGFLICACV